MASQVEIASSSLPFGCVLRDHNRRDRNPRDHLQKNSKDSSVINEEQKKSKIQGRWAQAREMVYNRPQIDNGVKNHKKTKLTREMVCSMLQIDQDDLDFNDGKIEKPKKQGNNVNDKKVINEVLQIDNGKNQNKSEIQEQWARAREKVCNQSQTEVKQSRGSFVHSPKANEQVKNTEKNQKPSKISDRWARARESICRINNSDEKDNRTSNVNIEGHKSNEDNTNISVQEDTKKLKKVRTHDRWARAREIVCALDRARDSNCQGVPSPILGAGVSSLLQKWKGYEAEAKSVNSNSNLNTSTNTSPGCSIKDNSGSTLLSRESSEAISADERDGNHRMMNIDTCSDSENDNNSVSGAPCTTGRESDVGAEEKETTRVVDLIRKLTTTSVGKTSQQGSNTEDVLESEQMLSSTESLPHVSAEMLSCPRVRGRQAFKNLLMQIERDRQRELEGLSERKAVSKFPNKGRLQALLKVKLMKRPQKNEDKDRMTPDSPVTSALNRGPNGSHIMHLREKFCTGAENSSKESADSVPSAKHSCSPTQTKVEARHHDVVNQKNSCQNTQDANKEVESNTSTSNQTKDDQVHHDVIDPKDSNKDRVHHVDAHIERKLSVKTRKDVEANAAQSNKKVSESPDYNMSDIIKETLGAETIWQDIESCQDWLSDISQLRSEWEQMCNDQQVLESNNDWISEVARPKSDWEDMRQVRYQEMLDPCSENRDIRQLLERKSVSSFLSSDMRDAIDRLMMSRTQKQFTPRFESYIAKQTTVVEEVKTDEYHCRNDDDDNDNNEDGSPIETRVNDRTHPVRQHSQSLLSPWMDIHDIAVSDYSNTNSPSLRKCESSNSSFPDNQHFSSFINSPYHSPLSLEMDFICDLRMHMEQLHQEMFQIRRSLKTCINMQVKLQRSVERSVRKEGKDSTRRDSEKGICSVCNDNHIDALLYRCGHMCTCFKCARDLQMSTGRCPICHAPILDVVRPYTREPMNQFLLNNTGC